MVLQIPVTARSAVTRLLGLWVRIPPGVYGCLSLLSVVSCQVDVPATGRSLVQRSRTECCVSECDRGTLTVRRLRPTRAVERLKNGFSGQGLLFLVSVNLGAFCTVLLTFASSVSAYLLSTTTSIFLRIRFFFYIS
jgi:hypothetical protein